MNSPMARREFLRLTTTSLLATTGCLRVRPAGRADVMPRISGVTQSSARLRIPPSTPANQTWRYCIPFPFQLAPRKAAIICNIRGNHPGDFEVGTDFIAFDSLSPFQPGKPLPISRIAQGTNPNSRPPGEPCWLIKQWIRVGFIPLGVKRADGSPHPNAGTGFGINEVIAWPLRVKQAAPDADDRPSDPYGGREHYGYHELHQFAYDGTEFRLLETESIPHGELLPGWSLGSGGMTSAIPDGDDLIIPFTGVRPREAGSLGLLRWRRREGKWRPESFAPAHVGNRGQNSFEPSLVRQAEGALLLCARGTGDNAKGIWVWRSIDSGAHWKSLLSLPDVLPRSPVALHQAAHGTPFIVANLIQGGVLPEMANRFPLPKAAAGRPLETRIRDTLCLWPLDVKGRRLLPPHVVRHGPTSFGPPPGGITWTIDHPIVANLQLSDGLWHTVLGYRVVDRAETDNGFLPPPQTGAYLEEVSSAGTSIPAWRF
jgi:hypothetical protein